MSFTLAIVGRPNVGKSTLFNRLVGKRLALVDDQPGVTRDLREGAARLGDLRFTVIDTAVSKLQQGSFTSDLVGKGTVTLSAGIASTNPGDVANLEELYKRADSALYSAKKHRPVSQRVPAALTRTGSWKL